MHKKSNVQAKKARGISGFFVVGSVFLFSFFQVRHIVAGDSGDLVTAAATGGVPHPPGYPLYTLLGWVLARVAPWNGPAWAVGLLSSIPQAFVVGLVWAIVHRITKSWIGATVASALLVSNYLFFMYGTTPEVFALFLLFLASLVAIVIRWDETHASRWLLAGAAVFGVSLAHHHVIVFLVPALAVYLWYTRKTLHKVLTLRLGILMLLAFIAGLLPYLYVPVAARGGSMVNWDHVTTIERFMRLITRADYGTFQSGALIGSALAQRFVSVAAYARFVILDFSFLGITLALLGLWGLWRKNRGLGLFFAIATVSFGPLFFFYASFPLMNRFTLGTYERFLLPSYTFFAILAGMGVAFGAERIAVIFKPVLHPKSMRVFVYGCGVMIVGFILFTGATTLWRFWGMSTDTTAERVGYDVLASAPPDSIVLLTRDTTLFITEYVRYALAHRPDTAVFHLYALAGSEYQDTVRSAFPDIIIPPKGDTFFEAFVEANRPAHSILTNSPFQVNDDYVWVPYGLLYELIPATEAPDVESLMARNAELWRLYQDPRNGILSRYTHLMIADVKDVYAEAHVGYGKVLFKAGKLKEAEHEFAAAVALDADTMISEAYTYLGITQLLNKECTDALESFASARRVSFVADSQLTLYEGITYQDCLNNPEIGKALIDEFVKHEQEQEAPLDPGKAGRR